MRTAETLSAHLESTLSHRRTCYISGTETGSPYTNRDPLMIIHEVSIGSNTAKPSNVSPVAQERIEIQSVDWNCLVEVIRLLPMTLKYLPSFARCFGTLRFVCLSTLKSGHIGEIPSFAHCSLVSRYITFLVFSEISGCALSRLYISSILQSSPDTLSHPSTAFQVRPRGELSTIAYDVPRPPAYRQ